MRGQLLRGLVDAASVAANLTKVLTTAAYSASSTPFRPQPQQQQQPRPWPTQAPVPRQTAQSPTQPEVEEEDEEQVIYTPPSPQPSASTTHTPPELAVAPQPSEPPHLEGPPATSTGPTPSATATPEISTPQLSESGTYSQSSSAPVHEPNIDAKQPAWPQEDPLLPDPTAASASSPPSPSPPLEAQRPSPQPQPQPQLQPVEDEYDPENIPRSTPLRAAKVPSSRLGRLMHYGSLGAGLAWGAAGQYLSGSSSSGSSPFMGEANLRRLVDKLSTMRGAALKLGQFMSIQDSHLLPPELEEVLLRVQNSANYMPEWQMEKVMTEDLGADWRSHFDHFNSTPFAAASIGQVHSATLSSSHPDSRLAGSKVAVKVQFPGIKQSIASDLGYLTSLLTASALLPKGLFLQSTIKTMRGELEDECDYAREAEMGRRFARLVQESNEEGSQIEGVMPFAVPNVVDELCTGRVLTTEMMRGRPLTQAARYSQQRRNAIATSILRLCLQELFHFRLMQTDPNWSNFLLNERTSTLELLDFGATREYTPEFIDKWHNLLSAAVRSDRDACLDWSHKIGYFTGEESEGMREAHLQSMLLLAEPFSAHAPSPYNFTNQTITTRVREHIPMMLRERKTPPPKETYSLNRKLSGAFLLCAKLGAEVRCKEVWEEVVGSYKSLTSSSSPASTGIGTNARAFHSVAHPELRKGSRIRSGRLTSHAQQSSILLRHPHIRARLRFDGPVSSMPISRAGHIALCPFSSSSQSHDDRSTFQSRQLALDLRSIWSRTSPRQTSRSSLAHFDLPPDPLGIDSTSPPTTDSISDITPVLGPNKQAEQAMKAALVGGDVISEKRTKISVGEETFSAEQSEENSTAAAAAAQVLNKPVLIRGTAIPRKPPPPGPEDCCMSGCAHCTYDIYADAIQEYLSELSHAQAQLAALSSPPLSEKDWAVAATLGIKRPSSSPEAAAAAAAGGDRKGADEERAQREVDEAVRNIEDPTLRAFLDMERKLKKKQREREKQAASAQT